MKDLNKTEITSESQSQVADHYGWTLQEVVAATNGRKQWTTKLFETMEAQTAQRLANHPAYYDQLKDAIVGRAKSDIKTSQLFTMVLPDLLTNINEGVVTDKFALLIGTKLNRALNGVGEYRKGKPFSDRLVVGEYKRELLRTVYPDFRKLERALENHNEKDEKVEAEIVSNYIKAISAAFDRFLKVVNALVQTEAVIHEINQRNFFLTVLFTFQKETKSNAKGSGASITGTLPAVLRALAKAMPEGETSGDDSGDATDNISIGKASLVNLLSKAAGKLAGLEYSSLSSEEVEAFESLQGQIFRMIETSEAGKDNDDVTNFVDSMVAA